MTTAKVNPAKNKARTLRRLAYRAHELPEIIGCGKSKVAEMIADGTLESVLVGRTRLVRAESVDKLLGGGQ